MAITKISLTDQNHGPNCFHPSSRGGSINGNKTNRALLSCLHNRMTINNFGYRGAYKCVTILLVVMVLPVVLFTGQRLLSYYVTHIQYVNSPITYLHRACPPPPYELLYPPSLKDQTATSQSSIYSPPPLKICITSLTDQKSPSLLHNLVRYRNYDGIMDLTRPVTVAYAQKYGYHVFDGSDYHDKSRPPAWSKIRAIQALFEPTVVVENENDELPVVAVPCDWVLWMDADTVIMNSDIRIEDLLPADPNKDLIVVGDDFFKYNSGVLLFRNSAWTKQFLDEWWNMKGFIQPPGLALPGDNAAFSAKLEAMVEQNIFDDHIVKPPRCTMNSYARFVAVRDSTEKVWNKNDTTLYYKGDFIAHIAGYDNKADCLKLLLPEAQ